MPHKNDGADTPRTKAQRKREASRKKQRRKQLVRAGVCVNCGKTHTGKRQKCDECADRSATRMRELYRVRQSAGLCPSCGKRKPGEFKRCAECRYIDRERRTPLTTTQTECHKCGRWLYDGDGCCDD